MRQHSGKKRLGAVLLSLALCLSLLPTAALAADPDWVDVEYTYYTWDGTGLEKHTSTVTAKVVTASDTAWGGSGSDTEYWYVVNSDTTISTRVTVTGDVHLILQDNCTLTVNGGIQVADNDDDPDTPSPNSLTIYGQSQGTGTLVANGLNTNAGIGGGSDGDGGTITIYGGTVSATSRNAGAGIGGGSDGDGGTITIYGGTVSATSRNTGAGIGGGSGGDGGTITIYGGTVSATSINTGAGIGGGSRGDGSTITIYGGTVSATSINTGAGIGGGSQGAGGAIAIYGGTVSATSINTGAGIGGGLIGGSGTFSTGDNGHAVIFASSIADNDDTTDWQGVIFQGTAGQVYGGTVTPTESFTISADYTLTIGESQTLTIKEGITLTNNGTITNNGTLTNNGTILMQGGTITGTVSGNQPTYSTSVEVSVSPNSATFEGAVTLTATITVPSGATVPADLGSVTFSVGEKTLDSTVNVTGSDGTYTAKLESVNVTAENGFVVGDNTITAAYSGVKGDDGNYGLAESSDTVTLTVNKAEQTAPSAPTVSTTTLPTANSITLNTVSGSGWGDVEYGYTTGEETSVPNDRWQNDTTFNGLSANTAYTFYARYAGNENYEPSPASNGTEIYTAYAAPKEDEGYTIDYATETVTADSGYEVRLADSNTWGTGPINITPGDTFQVRHAADTDGAPASAAVAFTIPARPDAPDVTGGVERIQGATTDMEYRTGDGAWTRFTQATVGRLDPGTYAVRLAATSNAFASDPVTVEVTQHTPPANPNYRVDIPTPENGTVTANPAAAKAGATVTLTATPDEGYEVGTVTVTDRFGDAVAVTENPDGTYTFTMPNGQVKVAVTFVEATPEPLPFTDVAEGDWFHDAVRYVYDNGLMDGVGDGQFAPNATTTRAQLVTILYRLAGEPAVSGDVAFTDVADGLWYSNAVAWAAEAGIVNGISATEFAPGGDLTREQLATILYRYAESMGYDVSARADLSGFPDAGDIQSYATQALSWAVAEGLLQGFEDDSLQPQSTATRAQIATILMRFCETVAK